MTGKKFFIELYWDSHCVYLYVYTVRATNADESLDTLVITF